MATSPPIVPQRNVPIQDPDSPQAFSLPWYRFFQQSTAGGSLTPGQIAALEAAIAAAATEAAAAQATASEALAAATEAQSDAESALLVGLVDLGNEDMPGPQGLRGERGSPGWDGEDGLDAMPIPGPPGPPGLAGLFVPGMDGLDGEDGSIGPPGLAGATGATGAMGAPGAQGGIGMPGLDGDEGPEGMPIPSPPSFSANPSATIGLSAVNGSATTFMTSDSAPPLSQGIVPTWTGQHTFNDPVLVAANGSASAPAFSRGTSGLYFSASNGAIYFTTNGTYRGSVSTAPTTFSWANSAVVGFEGAGAASAIDVILSRKAAANIQHGAADAASPVAQTISHQSVVAGTSNTSGAAATYVGSLATGSGTPGDLLLQTGFQGVAATSTVTISHASPAVITWAAHGLSVGQALQFTTSGGLPAPLAISTNYYIISAGFGSGSFEIALTPGSAAINTTTAGSGTQTALTATVQQAGVTALTIKGGTQQVNFAQPFEVAGDTTGSTTTAGLGTNSPAVSGTAPYTWIKMISSDGSTVYVPAYK